MKEFFELLSSPLLNIIALISTPIAYIFGGKMMQRIALKKETAVAKQTDADANTAIAAAYAKFLSDHNGHMEMLRVEIKELRTSNMEIASKQTNILLLYAEEQRKTFELEKMNTELTRKIGELEKKLATLTKAKEKKDE